MKKIMNKILIIFIIIVMMFEFIISSNVSYGFLNEEKINTITNLAGGIVSILYWPKRLTAIAIAFVIDFLSAQLAKESGINDSDGFVNDLLITPFNIFFNKYKLLDVNFFDIDDTNTDNIIYTFRSTVANWYYVMRLIAITILAVVLLYVGIRMALSTIAEEKAKYKKMLIDWCCSLVLLFLLHYIAIFIIYCNNAIVDALKDGMTDLSAETQLSNILVDIGLRGVLGFGITGLVAVLVFCFIVFQTIAFLIAYMNRVIKVGFLLIISPLITITYSIDKMGDGKAQALGAWLKEFIYTILIQPFHCLMYMAFVRPALTLLIGNETTVASVFGLTTLASSEYNQLANGLLAILCLKFINDGEKIVRKIFGFQDDNSSTSMAAGMAVGMLAVNNAKKIGAGVGKGINTSKNMYNRLTTARRNDKINFKSNAIKNQRSKIAKSKLQRKLGAFKSKLPSEKLKNIADKGGVKGFVAGKVLEHNSLSSTLGMMGAAMAYSTGSTDALTAIGTGSAIQKGSQELFASSKKTLTGQVSALDKEAEKRDFERLEDDIEETKQDIEKDEKALEDTNKLDEYKKLLEDGDEGKEKALRDKADTSDKDADEFQEKAAKAASKGNTKMAEHYQKMADKKRAEAQEMRNKADACAEARKKAEEMDEESDGRLSQITSDKDGFTEKLKTKKDKLKSLNNDKENFNSEENKRKRYEKRTKPSDESLKAKKREIVQKLIALKKAQIAKESGKSIKDVELTTEDTDTVEATATTLMDSIAERAAIPGSRLDKKQQRSFVKQQLGLGGDNYKGYQDLFKATYEYEDLQARIAMAKVNSNAQKVGISQEAFENERYGRYIADAKK